MGARSKEYLIEFNKLKMGLNEFNFTLNDQFLAGFDYSPVEHCEVNVDLKLIKTENIYDLSFDFKGISRVACDTCAEDIDMPIKQNNSNPKKKQKRARADRVEPRRRDRRHLSVPARVGAVRRADPVVRGLPHARGALRRRR
jgi:hypothetical protein